MPMLPEGTLISALIGGAISKVINDGVDYPKSKIKRVIKDRHDQNISTKIFRVIESSLNIVTDNIYKDSDDLYDAIEKIFIEFKNHNNTLESIKSGLNVLGADTSEQRCENFLEKFYEGIRRDDDLYKAIIMMLQQNGNKINEEAYQKLNEKLDNLTEIVSSKEDNKSDIQNREPVKSRTQEYADKWNHNMFLNDFDEWDEKAGVNVKLKDVYLEDLLPHFTWGTNRGISTNLKRLLSKYIYEKDDNKMLLILGQPGIGKSTLITWIVSNFTDMVNNILVYRFASDLKAVNWQSSSIAKIILETLGMTYNDLNGKTLIFDGYDEANIGEDRKEVLDKVYWNLIKEKSVKNFSIIITCRENYIQDYWSIKGQYIILKPWDEIQIKSFCLIFRENTNSDITQNNIENILKKQKIFGIPLILYMILALNISIEKEESITNIYDRIFSLKENSIYDRCIYGEPHRISEIKEQIHQVSRDIAMWMFENNSIRIIKEEYQKICNNLVQNQQKAKEIEQDFLIGNFFKLVKHCEGIESEEIYFVHRSIYEYFVAETIFSAIKKNVKGTKENFAGVLGNLLKGNILTCEILNFLNNKIKTGGLDVIFYKMNETFNLMLQDGMTYYVEKCYKNVMDCEMNIFVNILEIMHFWEKDCFIFNEKIVDYILCNRLKKMNLSKIDLHGVNLNKADLSKTNLRGVNLNRANLNKVNLNEAKLNEANLSRVDLRGADLSKADLRGVDLSESFLKGVDLRGANLRGVDLSETHLKKAIFDEEQIAYLKQDYNLQDTRVYIEKTGEIIGYEEHCKRKH